MRSEKSSCPEGYSPSEAPFRYNFGSCAGRGGEMADAADSKSAGATREGSNPSPGTRLNPQPAHLCRFVAFFPHQGESHCGPTKLLLCRLQQQIALLTVP